MTRRSRHEPALILNPGHTRNPEAIVFAILACLLALSVAGWAFTSGLW